MGASATAGPAPRSRSSPLRETRGAASAGDHARTPGEVRCHPPGRLRSHRSSHLGLSSTRVVICFRAGGQRDGVICVHWETRCVQSCRRVACPTRCSTVSPTTVFVKTMLNPRETDACGGIGGAYPRRRQRRRGWPAQSGRQLERGRERERARRRERDSSKRKHRAVLGYVIKSPSREASRTPNPKY